VHPSGGINVQRFSDAASLFNSLYSRHHVFHTENPLMFFPPSFRFFWGVIKSPTWGVKSRKETKL